MLQKSLPSLPLQDYVRRYQVRMEVVQTKTIFRPLPARTDQFMEFYLSDNYRLIDYESGKVSFSAPVLVVGPSTRRKTDLQLKGNYKVFTIHFQPAGFYRLFGIPARELTNEGWNAFDLIGRQIEIVLEQLQHSSTAREMITIAEGFLLKKLLSSAKPFHPVQTAAATIIRQGGQVAIDTLISTCNLSLRQLERQFDEQIGMSPKLYLRIARFNQALKLKEQRPDLTWTDITYLLNYYDQMHLIKDFRDLSGETPSKLSRLLAGIPSVFSITNSKKSE
jgi:AraC-like DNA-binding protein